MFRVSSARGKRERRKDTVDHSHPKVIVVKPVAVSAGIRNSAALFRFRRMPSVAAVVAAKASTKTLVRHSI
jgi:hypothetical protein